MSPSHTSPLTRLYIDTRPGALPSQRSNGIYLPLLSTLPTEIQTSVTAFIRLPDKQMSLASALLKFYFVHRTAMLPWSKITIKRWPKPHSRPYWEPPDDWHTVGGWEGEGGLEFNVSHQAGLTALIGCRTPTRHATLGPDTSLISPLSASSSSPGTTDEIRLGIDISCTSETRRTPTCTTQPELDQWIDVFSEMFSERERDDMKYLPISTATSASPDEPSTHSSSASVIAQKLRRFYTYWSLKEAFIKMIGEGLLAHWLRDLEFTEVRAPPPASASHASYTSESESETSKWTSPSSAVRDTKVFLRGQPLSSPIHSHTTGQSLDDTRPENPRIALEVVAYEDIFLITTAMKGVIEDEKAHNDINTRWVKLDIERDIRPCAEGRCRCLQF